MDLEYSFGEQVVVVPRNMPLNFKAEKTATTHPAIIGMAAVVDGYPLFAEAVNEHGVYCAGLNFPGYAAYSENVVDSKLNLAPYEIISYVVANCKTALEAKEFLQNVNVVAIKYADNLALPTLHWMIADKNNCYVLEATQGGVRLFENPIGVMTNSPNFDFHLTNLANFLKCSPNLPSNDLTDEMKLSPLGQGAGAIGIPGDPSTVSRFVRAVFNKTNSVCSPDELSSVSQVFHVLDSVAMVRGTVVTPDDKYDITTYSCCINADKGIYYYKTYDNNRISAVDMFKENLDGDNVICYSLVKTQQVDYIN